MRSVFPANCPGSRSNNAFFVHSSYFRSCRRATCLPVSFVLLSSICYLAAAQPAICCTANAWLSFIILHDIPTPSPFSNLNNVGFALSRCAYLHAHPPVAELSLSFSCAVIKRYPSQPFRVTRYCLYIEDPFIPFCLTQARMACLASATPLKWRVHGCQ
ncbi:hypothetical protein BJV77DRAFT_1011869 [Russula vinacea]|jgi:hypothetical protein|nr:hypothetical protein BJV77DRAFT_1011869 [Russula vinacea]